MAYGQRQQFVRMYSDNVEDTPVREKELESMTDNLEHQVGKTGRQDWHERRLKDGYGYVGGIFTKVFTMFTPLIHKQ